MMEKINIIAQELQSLSPQESLKRLSNLHEGKIVFSTSFGLEDQVITDMIFSNDILINVFTLDTGRLFQDTYDTMEYTRFKYKKNIAVFFPDQMSIEKLIAEKGPNSFYFSLENRKECCKIRKVEPLKRALTGNEVWITGLRADQSEHRASMQKIEWDPNNQIIKYHPILDWSLSQVQQYLKEKKVPVNILHNQGFPSIGCAPCTRAIKEGEDARAGRWWWETSHKECGLHK